MPEDAPSPAIAYDGCRGYCPAGGWIASYLWDFGDGSVPLVAGPLAGHTYAQAGTYVVTLTVTDNAGAGASGSNVVSPMTLSARGFKYHGANTVDLSWISPQRHELRPLSQRCEDRHARDDNAH